MGVVGLTRGRWAVVPAAAAMLWLMGCATVSDRQPWPDAQVQTDVPAGHDGEPQLMRGGDGLWYAVGEFGESVRAGQLVVGRYSGEWPLEETAAPALFIAEIAGIFGDDVMRVHPLYQFPEIDQEQLSLEIFDAPGEETMGKGIGEVEQVDTEEMTSLTLSLTEQDGVADGDMYAVLTERASGSVADAQLTRRLQGLCMVVEVGDEESRCRVHPGHPDHPGYEAEFVPGQMVTFLEATFAAEPREATILISTVDDDRIDDWMVDHLDSYLQQFPGANVQVELFDEQVDAADPAFHRWGRRVDIDDEPTLLMGASLEESEGEQRLVLNYTGLTPAVGPGMVAAPPEGGVDMGPVDAMAADDWRGVGSMLLGAVMVYRGQTAEALAHLHSALQDPALTGPWRWHSRDQYAMRWGALDRFEEALWLVHEDEAVARGNDDDRALYNALGTRARLHDYIDQPSRALEVADKYLQWRKDDRPDAGYLSALGMYAEMAVQNGKLEEAEQAVEELIELCPDGCKGDATALLAGVYWAATEHSPDLQDRAVEMMVDYGQAQKMNSLASARMFQGWTFLRDDDYDQALIAFLEAERLFEDRENSSYGAARAQFYISLTQVLRDEPQQAYEYGMAARDYMRQAGDYRSVARIYERLAEIYMSIDTEGPPQRYLGGGREVLQAAVQMQWAMGDYGRAAEAGFGYGNFLFRAGSIEEARMSLKQTVTRGLRVARFDMVAMSHMFLALIARVQGDHQLFREEMQRAELMAEIADDPYIDELLDELQSPPEQQRQQDDPTQLL